MIEHVKSGFLCKNGQVRGPFLTGIDFAVNPEIMIAGDEKLFTMKTGKKFQCLKKTGVIRPGNVAGEDQDVSAASADLARKLLRGTQERFKLWRSLLASILIVNGIPLDGVVKADRNETFG